MRILQVNTFDAQGGAAVVARDLHRAYAAAGHESFLAVGHRHGSDPSIAEIPNESGRNFWARRWRRWGRHLPAESRLRKGLFALAEPWRAWRRWRGIEDFDYPGTWRLMDLPPWRPDILHAHNLHGGYFDLRALPHLGRQGPVVLTLHDAWLLSGHCAHSLTCPRWRSGCGRCPDLRRYQPVRRDATARNVQRKQAIYRRSRLCVVTPCQWLMEKVQASMLAPAIQEARIIPNGVDADVFRPGGKAQARQAVGLDERAVVLLSVGQDMRTNPYKDFPTLEGAAAAVAERLPQRRVVLVVVGGRGGAQRAGRAEVVFAGYQHDPAVVAEYYRSADVYVHASRAETFPNSVLEAMACGAVVAATDVGGIGEIVRPGETGLLTPAGDAPALAAAMVRLLTDANLSAAMKQNGREVALADWALAEQARRYLGLYEELLARG